MPMYFKRVPTHTFLFVTMPMYGISPCRSKNHPWGLPVFEKHPAIIISNKIIQNTLKLVVWLAKHGIRVSIENPHSSCLWSLPEIHEMVLQVGHSTQFSWVTKLVFGYAYGRIEEKLLFLDMPMVTKLVFTSPSRTQPTGTTLSAIIAAMACSTARGPASFHASFTSFLCKRGLAS